MLCGIYNKLLGWEDFQLEALSAIIRFIFISQSFIWNHLQREVLQHTILIIEMTSSGGDFGNPDSSAHICAHTDRFGLCLLYCVQQEDEFNEPVTTESTLCSLSCNYFLVYFQAFCTEHPSMHRGVSFTMVLKKNITFLFGVLWCPIMIAAELKGNVA